MADIIATVARTTAHNLCDIISDGSATPPEAVIGGLRGAIVFWMSCVEDGKRHEALEIIKQMANEEIDGLIRGIANGMVPA